MNWTSNWIMKRIRLTSLFIFMLYLGSGGLWGGRRNDNSPMKRTSFLRRKLRLKYFAMFLERWRTLLGRLSCEEKFNIIFKMFRKLLTNRVQWFNVEEEKNNGNLVGSCRLSGQTAVQGFTRSILILNIFDRTGLPLKFLLKFPNAFNH